MARRELLSSVRCLQSAINVCRKFKNIENKLCQDYIVMLEGWGRECVMWICLCYYLQVNKCVRVMRYRQLKRRANCEQCSCEVSFCFVFIDGVSQLHLVAQWIIIVLRPVDKLIHLVRFDRYLSVYRIETGRQRVYYITSTLHQRRHARRAWTVASCLRYLRVHLRWCTLRSAQHCHIAAVAHRYYSRISLGAWCFGV